MRRANCGGWIGMIKRSSLISSAFAGETTTKLQECGPGKGLVPLPWSGDAASKNSLLPVEAQHGVEQPPDLGATLSTMAEASMPMLIINMGGEMVYILEQRLTAQAVATDKAKRGAVALEPHAESRAGSPRPA